MHDPQNNRDKAYTLVYRWFCVPVFVSYEKPILFVLEEQ